MYSSSQTRKRKQEIYSSIYNLKLRPVVKQALVQIAIEIEIGWIDRVTELIKENKALKKQLKSGRVSPK